MLVKTTDDRIVLTQVGTRCVEYAPAPPVPSTLDEEDPRRPPSPPSVQPPPPLERRVYITRNYRDSFGRCWREVFFMEDDTSITVQRELAPFACG